MGRSDLHKRKAFLAALTALGALASCQGILGLGKFKDCTEKGADCSVDGRPDAPIDVDTDSSADGGADADADAEFPVPDGAVRSSWAAWRMPNSREPGDGGPQPSSYGNYGPLLVDATPAVIETLSNLVWLNTNDVLASRFEEARDACAGQGPGWRLPTRIELVTLLDYGSDAGNFLPSPAFFTNLGPGTYWTSSVAGNNGKDTLFWVVDFSRGTVVRATRINEASRVVCIRGS